MTVIYGKPSFKFQMSQVMAVLDEKKVQQYFVIIQDTEGIETDFMKDWVCASWRPNRSRASYFTELNVSNMTYVQEAAVMFRTTSKSPQNSHAIVYPHGNLGGWSADFLEDKYRVPDAADDGHARPER